MRRSCLFIRVSSLPTISSSSWDGSLTPRSRCRILPKIPGPPEGPSVEVSVPSSRARISTAGSSACWPRIGTPAFRFFSPKRRSSQWIVGCCLEHRTAAVRGSVSVCLTVRCGWTTCTCTCTCTCQDAMLDRVSCFLKLSKLEAQNLSIPPVRYTPRVHPIRKGFAKLMCLTLVVCAVV